MTFSTDQNIPMEDPNLVDKAPVGILAEDDAALKAEYDAYILMLHDRGGHHTTTAEVAQIVLDAAKMKEQSFVSTGKFTGHYELSLGDCIGRICKERNMQHWEVPINLMLHWWNDALEWTAAVLGTDLDKEFPRLNPDEVTDND